MVDAPKTDHKELFSDSVLRNAEGMGKSDTGTLPLPTGTLPWESSTETAFGRPVDTLVSAASFQGN